MSRRIPSWPTDIWYLYVCAAIRIAHGNPRLPQDPWSIRPGSFFSVPRRSHVLIFLLDVRLDSNYWSALVSPGRSTCLHIWRCSSWPALTRALMRIIHHNEFIYNLKLRVSFIVKVVNLSLKSCIVTLNCGVARSKKRNITRRIYRNLCSIWVGYQKGFIKMQRRLINLYHVLTFHLNIIILEWFWLCNWTTKPSACGAVIFHYFFLLNEFDYSISLFQEQRLIADSN